MVADSHEFLRHLPHPIADLFAHTPRDWIIRNLDSLVESNSPICYGILMPGEDQPDGVPVVKVKNIRNGKVDVSSLLRTTPKIDEKYSRSRLCRGDVLLSIRGSVGEVAIACEALDNANITQDTARIRLNDECDHEFVFFALQCSLIQRQIDLNTIGQAVTGINIREVRRLALPFPPLPEQQKIAAILSTWDRALALAEKLIAAKQKRKQALMQQLLSGKVRFAEFVRSRRYQNTPLGEMPIDWKNINFASVVEKIKRKNDVGEEHVLTASGEYGLVDQREFFNRSVAGADLSKYYLLRRGDFAYNRSFMNGYPYGAFKRLDHYEQGVLSTLYICFALKDTENYDSDFLCHFFEGRLLDRQLRGITQVGGRAHGLLNITEGDFYSMKLVLPSTEEQRQIAAVLSTQDREILKLKDRLTALSHQKQGLMQKLLTGQIRVGREKSVKSNALSGSGEEFGDE